MLDILSLPFMQRALIAGILVAGLASYLGVFVVQRGLSFLGSGLAHAAFGGVALGLLLNTEPLWVAIPFTVFVAVAITWVHEQTDLSGDTTIGIFFSVSVALGVIFLFLKREYTADAFTYLFGSILAVTPTDLWLSGGVVMATALLSPVWCRWAYRTFDRELAEADRLPVQFDDYLLSILIAVTIVVAVKVVGIILIAAFLVIPAAVAKLISRTFIQMTLYAMGTGVFSATIGLFASYYLDMPSGAMIILVQAVLFFTGMILRRIVRF
ncbi:MAG: metal ABC transporter permease [Gemmatimonadetes bacterium]|nr:MAG: metal ABC transporter permease [Gemmatimonadota bacterium]